MIAIGGKLYKIKIWTFQTFFRLYLAFLSFAPVCVGISAGEQEKEEK